MGKKGKSKTKDFKKYEKKKSITKTPLSEEVQVWMIERLKLKVKYNIFFSLLSMSLTLFFV